MQEGLYTGEFETPFGKGTGVLHFSNGEINGGNSALFYVGTYSVDGNTLNAEVRTKRFTISGEVASIFGVDDITIHMEGEIDGDTIVIDGVADEVPDMQMRGKLSRVNL
ncbi:GrlR family regulatory protein [Sneathiella limimaris]|uniref:GrlR family regulatory protein n=1 Tax=Sneathiella limimaris TaxID=1964213 RepID=UPI001469D837|nr:GrlR family regulatory protein [Sneathiella limimaris]